MGWFSRKKLAPPPTREPQRQPSPAELDALAYLGGDLIAHGDYNEAIEVLTAPAKARVVMGMFNLAVAYMMRGSVNRAMYWYENAAEVGDVDAMAYLGYLFRAKNELSLARQWLTKAAEAGNGNAATMLRELDLDPESPAALVVAASSKVMADAHANAGRLDLAKQGWLAAAHAGNVEAFFELGKVHIIERNFGEGIIWLTRAQGAGHYDASRLLAAAQEAERQARVRTRTTG